MNVLIAILLVILIGVVIAIGMLAWSMFKHIKRILKTPPTPWDAPLQAEIERTQMMGNELKEFTEQMKGRMSRERDVELAAYAQMRRNKQMIPNPLPTWEDDGRVHTKNPDGKNILIPENLTEEERQTLKDFYNL